MDRIKLTGFVNAEAEIENVGDLRALVKWFDKYAVSDEVALDFGVGKVFVGLVEAGKAEWIECGDHMPPNYEHDVIVVTHTHE